jgi:phosphoglycolate phosphatase
MYRLVVFDLDGTLVDSRLDIADAVNDILQANGARPLPLDDVGRMVGEGVTVLMARAFAAVDRAEPPDAAHQFVAAYDARLLEHTRPYPGIPQALAELAGRTLAVLTNKPLAATQKVLAGLDLARYFTDELVIGGDGPFPRKPDPSGFADLASRAGIPVEQSILVGDSLIDWRTARNAGTNVCTARYGFGFDRLAERDVREGDRFVDAPEELPRVL